MAETATATSSAKSRRTLIIATVVIGGGLGLWFLYRYYEERKAGSTTATTTAATTLATIGGAGTGTTTTPSLNPVKSLTTWIEAIIRTTRTVTPAMAYNTVTNWQSGQCVTAKGYALISRFIAKLGLPSTGPSYPVTVCRTAGSTTPTTTLTGTGTTTKSPPTLGIHTLVPAPTGTTSGQKPATNPLPVITTHGTKLQEFITNGILNTNPIGQETTKTEGRVIKAPTAAPTSATFRTLPTGKYQVRTNTGVWITEGD